MHTEPSKEEKIQSVLPKPDGPLALSKCQTESAIEVSRLVWPDH